METLTVFRECVQFYSFIVQLNARYEFDIDAIYFKSNAVSEALLFYTVSHQLYVLEAYLKQLF